MDLCRVGDVCGDARAARRLHVHASGRSGSAFRATTFAQEGMSRSEVALGHCRLRRDIDLWAWVTRGDPKPYVHASNYGMLFAAVVVLSLAGAVIVLARRRDDPWWRFVLAATVLAPIPAALTEDRLHGLRLVPLAVLLPVLSVPALSALARAAHTRPKPTTAVASSDRRMGRAVRGLPRPLSRERPWTDRALRGRGAGAARPGLRRRWHAPHRLRRPPGAGACAVALGRAPSAARACGRAGRRSRAATDLASSAASRSATSSATRSIGGATTGWPASAGHGRRCNSGWPGSRTPGTLSRRDRRALHLRGAARRHRHRIRAGGRDDGRHRRRSARACALPRRSPRPRPARRRPRLRARRSPGSSPSTTCGCSCR